MDTQIKNAIKRCLKMSLDKICIYKENTRHNTIENETDSGKYKCYECDGYLKQCPTYIPVKEVRKKLGADKYGRKNYF
jgi:hypothetical protein